jgi:hypothetical protein
MSYWGQVQSHHIPHQSIVVKDASRQNQQG